MIKKTLLFAREIWTLLRPYWQSDERAIAWLVLAATMLLTLGLLYMNVLFNSWYNFFYDALQKNAMAVFYQRLRRFCMLAAIFIVIAVYQVYLNQMLQVRWRQRNISRSKGS